MPSPDKNNLLALILGRVTGKDKRYLLAAAWNALFGYGIAVGYYIALEKQLHTIIIGLLINVTTITMSFLTYKIFVFKTVGNWLSEYYKCYVVYSGVMLVSIALLWLLVDNLNISVWIAQLINIVASPLITYFAHNLYTFARHD